METMYSMSKKKREEWGLAGRNHVMENYNFENFNKLWVDVMTKIYEEEGSWETRKHSQRWTIKEIAL